MKRLIFIVFFLIPSLVSAQITRVPATDTSEPAATEDQQEDIEDALAPVLNMSFEQRQKAILAAVDEALKILAEQEQLIKDSLYLSEEQKNELLPIIDAVEQTLTEYQTAVSQAEDSSDLLEANKALITKLKTNKSQIQQAVATVVMIAVEEAIDVAEEYLLLAEAGAEALEVCKVDVADIKSDIDQANKMLIELETLFNQIMADKKVSENEYSQVKQAAKLTRDINKLIAEITIALEEAAFECPVLQE